MKLEMADDLLKFDIESFVLWTRAIRSPFLTMQQLIAEDKEEKRLSGAFQLWVIAAILSTAVAAVITELTLRTRSDLKDLLNYFIVGMLFFLLTVLLFHLTLRLLGIDSEFSKTAVLQSVITSYSPITTVFWVLFLRRELAVGHVSGAYSWHSWPEMYVSLLSAILRSDSMQGLRYLGWCGPVLLTILLALLAEGVCRSYGGSRFRAQMAVIVSTVAGAAIPFGLFFLAR